MTPFTSDECRQERQLKENQILAAIEKLNKRLFVDNGDLSIQTRLDRLTQAHRQNVWFARAIGAAMLVQIFMTIIAKAS